MYVWLRPLYLVLINAISLRGAPASGTLFISLQSVRTGRESLRLSALHRRDVVSRVSVPHTGTLDKARRSSFYGHRLCSQARKPLILQVWHNLIAFVRIMCAITDFNLGSVSRNHSLVGPGITYRALLRVCSLCVRDHF